MRAAAGGARRAPGTYSGVRLCDNGLRPLAERAPRARSHRNQIKDIASGVVAVKHGGGRMKTSARRLFAGAALLAAAALGVGQAMAMPPIMSCDSAGIGSVTLVTDDQPSAQATILSA